MGIAENGFEAPAADDPARVCNRQGITLAQQGRLDEAVTCFQQALQLRPDYFDAHNNLGNVLMFQGRLDEAVASYQRALRLVPPGANDLLASLYNHLGNVFRQQGKLSEAVAYGQRALDLQPNNAKVHNNLGNALREQGLLDEAEACYRRALMLEPNFAEAYYNRAIVARDQRNSAEAIACCRRALEIRPDYAEAHNILGLALQDQGRIADAMACFRRAIELKPDLADAHNSMGNALREQGRLDDAVVWIRRALELKPDLAEAHNALGLAWQDRGRIADALACYQRAIELKPQFAEAHLNRALLWLLKGDFEQGLVEYEWRWRARLKPLVPCPYQRPYWDGGPLEGKTLLLHAEQGLGDTIQFIRYAAVARERGARVVLGCPKPLLRILRSCRFLDRLVEEITPALDFDVYCPLMSLPGVLKTTLESVPAEVPYLFASQELVQKWRERLGSLEGFKIGIGWQGSPTYVGDRWRSIPLRSFAPLAEMAGIRLVSLQKTAGREQLAELGDRFPVADFAEEMDEAAGPFMDTAAMMTQLDLAITSDTAIAHLAGALGVAVWVALPLVPDWRWLLDRSDNPWYPTMRLFRQQEPGDWTGVFDRIRDAMERREDFRF